MFQVDVLPQRPEERDSGSNEDWEPADGQIVDEVGSQEGLDGLAAIHVEAMESAFGKASYNVLRLARHRFDGLGHVLVGDGSVRQHDDRLVPIVPRRQPGHDVEGVAAHDERIDVGKEIIETVVEVGVTGLLKPLEIAVLARDKSVQAGSDEYGHA
jgi:hypothetical protein